MTSLRRTQRPKTPATCHSTFQGGGETTIPLAGVNGLPTPYTEWQKVVFSDKTRFVLGTDDNRVGVWRRPGERIQIEEELLHKSDDEASGQKKHGKTPPADNSAHLSKRHFMSHIPPTPVKREPSRHFKVCCSRNDADGI
ncbi:hypothetical protein TNCV_4480151 [Trichonephila clavipes]|nr:hypothetical protein TNCV_4480151 [Trichonephila clavipes]